MHAHQLILDSKSLLLELTIQSREARIDGKEKIHPLDHSRVNQTHQVYGTVQCFCLCPYAFDTA